MSSIIKSLFRIDSIKIKSSGLTLQQLSSLCHNEHYCSRQCTKKMSILQSIILKNGHFWYNLYIYLYLWLNVLPAQDRNLSTLIQEQNIVDKFKLEKVSVVKVEVQIKVFSYLCEAFLVCLSVLPFFYSIIRDIRSLES